MEKINLISIPVNTGSYNDFVETIITAAKNRLSQYACVANVHMLVEAHKSRSFASIVGNANFVTPDGKPLAWAMRLLYGIKQDRVAGMDLLPDLLHSASIQKLTVYFYGGTYRMLEKTRKYLYANYPGLKIVGYNNPPFRKLTEEETAQTIEKINESGANLVFVALGCPKQEQWMAEMNGKINAVCVGIGGALPVMVGMQKRAPKWMQKNGLEWFFRLMQEPGRLFKRYAITNSMFIYLLTREYFHSRNISHPAA